ncbi:hypothetical protein GV819_25065 [Pseudomonas sp. Fl5BN2]|uniref:CPCC family cysteine-rich protein n=1 Tax=unclassified Pseudomonas TaxID=196821 RepID=UPI0013779E74|nr:MULTISPECIES: CPCC family cysteine-rich protein [unclassified Pseudomonas]NBF05570.1 hypothetical protein [Pseudomonas sp. Fl5BN2]NBF10611.1 hypothetical protein [Pseudomonas sp. Fl4BN1]
MEKLTRLAAIDRLSRQRLLSLSALERYDQLLNRWSIDDGDPEFATLPATLRQELLQHQEPPENVQDPHYDPLILLNLRAEYRSVTAQYLTRCLLEAGCGEHQVDEPVEPLLACPCCGYLTLGARGEYEICDLCHWEDDGSNAADALSGPNHMTLRQAREQFARSRDTLPLDKWPRASENAR